MRVLQSEDINVSEDFLYDLTLQLYLSADPFDTAAHNFMAAQKLMIDEQRTHYRSSMRNLQTEQKEMALNHLQLVSQLMRETCDVKDKELMAIKAELTLLKRAHTLLMSQHAVLNLKTAQSGAEGYSQLLKDYKDLQAKYKAKEEACTFFEQQCNFLSEAFQEQSMVLPPGGPISAQASLSIGYDLDLEGPAESLARERLAHDNSGLN
jgi:hypothetical protein